MLYVVIFLIGNLVVVVIWILRDRVDFFVVGARVLTLQLGQSEAWCDVLRAVPVVGNDLDEEQPFHSTAERSGGKLID